MQDQDKPKDKEEERVESTKGQEADSAGTPANADQGSSVESADILLSSRIQRGIFGANDVDYEDLKREEEENPEKDA
ncbi:hypothetical protein [Telluribacter sp. SYSU D00476]|uniref:hypothetical protein n=1 Tax=Telluribacter sp. SYSU D00476 TaxID=2811430 RepID=UPI001FF291B7|nr:hypothetical protein [Telluribacter sp. SYSU D00476]